MEIPSEKRYPVNAKDYNLHEEVGEGVSATVYKALCIPLKETVAIKALDLEKCNNDLDGIRREVQTMTLIDHPNLLKAHCSFTAGHHLWVVMPYMSGGSCLHIMKSAFSEGFDEPVIATLLREVLKALVYLHAHGHIHRDVKAGNILLDSNGTVKLADFGVSACMFDTGDRQRSRNTFVGTPCWMAPEVMQQLHGYDFKADIWSFGITALELAHGHAPFSKYPPMKVLLMTLQNAPPGLDYERDRKFSKSFKEMVATCLVKDPKKRPSSEKLLKHPFFKHARSVDYLARTILDGLDPLGERFKKLKAKEADLLVQNKALYGDKEHLSQQEYIRGISAWNFNLEDLKNQAALIQDDDMSNMEDLDVHTTTQRNKKNDFSFPVEGSSLGSPNHRTAAASQEDGFSDLHYLESSLASFPTKPLEALKDCFDIYEDISTDSVRPVDRENGRIEGESSGQSGPLPRHYMSENKRSYSGSLISDNAVSPKKIVVDGDRDYVQSKFPSERNFSGPLLYRQKRDTNNISSVEDTSDGTVVQCKGRFKVTSAELSPKGPMTGSFSPICGGTMSPTSLNLTPSLLLPSMQCILQQNILQREEIVKLIKYLEQLTGKNPDVPETATNDPLQTPPASLRERELQSQVVHLQQRIDNLNEELEKQKLKNAEFERHMISMANKERT
ncbi:serine/threonine-protein kinase fray2-like isoform X1 [Cucurbita pepo subsp. pepo]|uniref:serine/threonine-protein kinase fray2-like isoform X1 n=1 Tax=Cucurbita pepo subsp. pepo TaxID=3664 RepID=UPI000C9D4EF2|nr:serine/threonine-protein kinase fray2-like isoform X1 [Cucurbita pepo subsp. pepo]